MLLRLIKIKTVNSCGIRDKFILKCLCSLSFVWICEWNATDCLLRVNRHTKSLYRPSRDGMNEVSDVHCGYAQWQFCAHIVSSFTNWAREQKKRRKDLHLAPHYLYFDAMFRLPFRKRELFLIFLFIAFVLNNFPSIRFGSFFSVAHPRRVASLRHTHQLLFLLYYYNKECTECANVMWFSFLFFTLKNFTSNSLLGGARWCHF